MLRVPPPFDNRGSCDAGRSQGRAAARPERGANPAAGRRADGCGVGAGNRTRRDYLLGPRPAAQWAAGAPAPIRVHAVTGLTRSARVLQDRSIHILAGAVPDLTALVARSALKLDSISTVVIAWPELLAAGEHAAALDTLLGEARDARRIVLSWNPALLGDFLERHARRALVVGTPPLDEAGAPLSPVGPARYVVVAPGRRGAAVREAIDLLDPRRPLVWE